MVTYTAPKLIASGDVVRETRLGPVKGAIESIMTRPSSTGTVGFNL